MTLSMKDLVRMPYIGTASQHSLGKEPFGKLEPELVSEIHKRMIRAAGFVARDFRIANSVIPLYGWQSCNSLGYKEAVRWECWLFGDELPERRKERYADLSAAFHLEDWAWPAKNRSKERHCPLVVADLGPAIIGGHTRISNDGLKELAMQWEQKAPVLDKKTDTRLEAMFCLWDNRVYLLTVPLFLHDIQYQDVLRVAEESIATMFSTYIQTPNDHITLWHIGNFENIDYVHKKQSA